MDHPKKSNTKKPPAKNETYSVHISGSYSLMQAMGVALRFRELIGPGTVQIFFTHTTKS